MASRLLTRGIVCLLSVLACRSSSAAPWENLFVPRSQRVPADPNGDYVLKEHHGPWLILATTFYGDQAMEEARELALEFRRRYKLEAFVHDREFDYTGTVQGLGVDRYGDPKRMRYANSQRRREVAVLCGQFRSVDDPLAQRMLNQVKKMRPECLKDEESQTRVNADNETSLLSFRNLMRSAPTRQLNDRIRFVNRKQGMGLLAGAFLVPNPMVGAEDVRPPLDPLVYEINKNAQYSLLRCPGRYTVVVATFRGFTSVDQQQIHDVMTGAKRRLPSRLEEAALRAHQLAAALHAKGYEAYEFHDVDCSTVCVGSFDWVGNTRPDGTIELNPKVKKVIETFGTTLRLDPRLQAPVPVEPKTLAGIPFDPRPVPVEVPRPPLGMTVVDRR